MAVCTTVFAHSKSVVVALIFLYMVLCFHYRVRSELRFIDHLSTHLNIYVIYTNVTLTPS